MIKKFLAIAGTVIGLVWAALQSSRASQRARDAEHTAEVLSANKELARAREANKRASTHRAAAEAARKRVEERLGRATDEDDTLADVVDRFNKRVRGEPAQPVGGDGARNDGGDQAAPAARAKRGSKKPGKRPRRSRR